MSKSMREEIETTINVIGEPFDPLDEMGSRESRLKMTRQQLVNIAESYQDSYDFLRELAQNAADAVQERFFRKEKEGMDYTPRITIILDLAENMVTVADNGEGLSPEQARKLLLPSYTDKKERSEALGQPLRGYKGVGLSYLAFNFNYIRISSRGPQGFLCYVLEGGRRWLFGEEEPPLQAYPSQEPLRHLLAKDTGTLVTIGLDSSTIPSSLSRLGGGVSKWEAVLRTTTAIGLVDLSGEQGWREKAEVELILKDAEGRTQRKRLAFEFLYPHQVKGHSFLDLKKYYREHPECPEPPTSCRNQDALFRVWDSCELFSSESLNISSKDFPLLSSHRASVYGFYAHSSRLFDALSRQVSGDDRMRPIRPGIQVAMANSVEGRPLGLEPKFEVSSRQLLFVLVELERASIDLGRKGFSSQLEAELQSLGLKILGYFSHQRTFLKSPDVPVTSQAVRLKGLEELREEARRRKASSSLPPELCLRVDPANEPEVILLFAELLGRGLLKGYRIYGCFHNTIYDGLFESLLSLDEEALFQPEENPLGVSEEAFGERKVIEMPLSCLEFKVNLNDLIKDFEDESCSKRFEDLQLAVVWRADFSQNESYEVIDIASTSPAFPLRELHGTTHLIRRKGVRGGHAIHVIALQRVIDVLKRADLAGQKERSL